MEVVFRADASIEIGTGHVVRCLTLADALCQAGASCRFISRAHDGNMIDVIRSRGYVVTALPRSNRGSSGLPASGETNYADLLGVSWDVDAMQTVAALGQSIVDCVVVDHYAIDARWESLIRKNSRQLVVIDDLANRPHECDLLLDQNWFGDRTQERYRSLVPQGCRTMLGPTYALLRPEYAKLRSWMPPRDGIVKRVLVFMGGSDPLNQTGDVLEALTQPGLDHLAVDVVVGLNHPDPQSIAQKVAARPASNLFSGLPSLAGLMARADLMIGGGGSTTWERMCLGLPAIVISIADNQTPTNVAMMKAGYIDFLGQGDKISVDVIATAVREKLADVGGMQLMSRLSQELVQGMGAPMLAKCLLGK